LEEGKLPFRTPFFELSEHSIQMIGQGFISKAYMEILPRAIL